MPEGTIYAFPDVSAPGIPDRQLAAALLRGIHVAVEAGSFYGPPGAGHLQVCFGAESYERIEIALDRISAYLGKVRRRLRSYRLHAELARGTGRVPRAIWRVA